MIELEFDDDLITRELARLEGIPHAIQRALYPAVTEVLDIARVNLVTRLTADVPLPAKIIRKSVKSRMPQVSGQGIVGNLHVSSKAISLIEYGVTPKAITARQGVSNTQWPGFSYSLRSGKSKQREELQRLEPMKGLPFIAAMHNAGRGGHLGIYRRTPQGQIKEIYGPRMQYHATTPEIEAYLIQSTEDNFRQILSRIVTQVLAGGSA